ncbi:MAG: CDC27 family protein [Pirellulales bacterium]
MFKGYVLEQGEPRSGLSDIQEGLRRRNSPIGRALLTFALINRAIDTGNPADVEEAIAEANVAERMLPNNSLVLYVSLYARLVAAASYKEAQLEDRYQAILMEASKDADQLMPYLEQPNAAWAIWLYFNQTGDKEKALELARRSFELSQHGPFNAYIYAISLYEQDRIKEAIACLDRRRKSDIDGDILRAFLVAEDAGRDAGLEEYNKLVSKYSKQDSFLLGDILFFLGETEKPTQRSKSTAPSTSPPRTGKHLWKRTTCSVAGNSRKVSSWRPLASRELDSSTPISGLAFRG